MDGHDKQMKMSVSKIKGVIEVLNILRASVLWECLSAYTHRESI